MKIGIVVFPGTTCERDTFLWCEKGGHEPFYVSHKETEFPSNTNLIIIPGGFAFGDRVYEEATGDYIKNPGVQALSCPIMDGLVLCWNKVPILGICNGFQILVHAGMLGGSLQRNSIEKFHCDHTYCQVRPSFIFSEMDEVIDIPIAHGYGRYVSPRYTSAAWRENHVFLYYADEYNVNGSDYNIAGVCNTERTVWGMMPHPERSPHSQELLKGIEDYVARNF